MFGDVGVLVSEEVIDVLLEEGLGLGGGAPDAGVGCLQVALEGDPHADEVGSVVRGGRSDGGHGVGLGGGFIMGLWGMCCGEPGRLVDKDRGLWTLRREFESRPGYF